MILITTTILDCNVTPPATPPPPPPILLHNKPKWQLLRREMAILAGDSIFNSSYTR